MIDTICGICGFRHKGICLDYGIEVDFLENQICTSFFIQDSIKDFFYRNKDTIEKLINDRVEKELYW